MRSRYDIEGRLADVIAALTVMAAAKESEGSLKMWANRLSRPGDPAAIDQSAEYWKAIFNDHREFFLVYEWQNEEKAALRMRYANKTIDRATGQPPANLQLLTQQQRGDLTSLPLEGTTTSALVNTAISLHQATLARKADGRFYFQTFGPAVLALIGGLLGALISVVLKPTALSTTSATVAPATVTASAPNDHTSVSSNPPQLPTAAAQP